MLLFKYLARVLGASGLAFCSHSNFQCEDTREEGEKKAGAGGGREFVPRRSETRNGIAKH